MLKNKLVWLILLFVLGMSFDSYSQKRKYGMQRKTESRELSDYRGGSTGYRGIGISKYSTIGFSINAMNYYGDIAPLDKRFSQDIAFTRAGFGLTYSRVVDPNAAIRLGLNWGRITGEDFRTADPVESTGRYMRNLHFRNDLIELSLGVEFNLIPNSGGSRNRFPLNPYFFLGIVVFKHNPQAIAPDFDLQGNPLDEGGEWVDLMPLGTEGQNDPDSGLKPYGLVQFAIPLGVGVKLKLPGGFDANFEIGWRQTLTDYLDDVSRGYADLGALDNELARALSDRGTENIALLSGGTRDPELIRNRPFTSPANGQVYNVGGNYQYNSEDGGGIRGSCNDNDIYVVTQLRLVYILEKKSVKKAKFR